MLSFKEFINEAVRTLYRANKLGTYLTKRYPAPKLEKDDPPGVFVPQGSSDEFERAFSPHYKQAGAFWTQQERNKAPGEMVHIKSLIPIQNVVHHTPAYFKNTKYDDDKPAFTGMT